MKRIRLLLTVMVGLLPAVLLVPAATADENTAAIRAELDALKAQYEARIEALEQRLTSAEQQLAQQKQQQTQPQQACPVSSASSGRRRSRPLRSMKLPRRLPARALLPRVANSIPPLVSS